MKVGNSAIKTQAIGVAEIHKLGDAGHKAAVPFLIKLMKSTKSVAIRNAAAVALRQLKDIRALPHLIALIKNPKTKNSRGSLLYALQVFNCAKYMAVLVNLVISEPWEASHEAVLAIQPAKHKRQLAPFAKKIQKAIPSAPEYKQNLLKQLLVD